MTTVLFYLVIAAVIGLVVFLVAVLVFGRGEQMAPLDPRTSPAELPDHDVDAEDVRKIRFALALRGYRMSDVDWTLERLGEQISSLRMENAHLRDRLSLEGPSVSGDDPQSTDGQGGPDAQVGPAAQGGPDAQGGSAAQVGPRADTATRSDAEAEGADRWGPPQERLAERAAAPAVDR